MPELDPSQSKLLGALTVTALKHLGESTLVVDEDNALSPDWRMARLGDVALLEKPADGRSPKRIDCYQITEHSAHGGTFKLDPARLVYSLRWLHKAEPPDYEMVLVQAEPVGWVNTANLVLLGALRRRAPSAIDWAGLTAAGVVQMLDDFRGRAVSSLRAAQQISAAHREVPRSSMPPRRGFREDIYPNITLAPAIKVV